MNEEKKIPAKRVDIVSIKLCKESSFLYEPRRLSNPLEVAKLCRNFLDGLDREQLIVISVNTKCEPVNFNWVSIGSVNATLAVPREIFKPAVLSSAAHIIVAHNHPSGDPTPSREDAKTTERIARAGDLMGIPLLDHIIIGSDGDYYSFGEEGNL